MSTFKNLIKIAAIGAVVYGAYKYGKSVGTNENENNLINRIGNFIDKHTPKNWDVNVHKDINPK